MDQAASLSAWEVRAGTQPAAMAAWRGEPSFVLNQPAYAAGSVLVAGPVFLEMAQSCAQALHGPARHGIIGPGDPPCTNKATSSSS